MRFFNFYLLSLLALFFFACSDEDDGIEYMFDREISEYSVLRDCGADAPEGSSCYKIRYRYPIQTDFYSGLCVWLDTSLINDTSKAVSDKQLALAHDCKVGHSTVQRALAFMNQPVT